MQEGRRGEEEQVLTRNISMWRRVLALFSCTQRVQISEPDSSQEQDRICNADVLEVELEFTL